MKGGRIEMCKSKGFEISRATILELLKAQRERKIRYVRWVRDRISPLYFDLQREKTRRFMVPKKIEKRFEDFLNRRQSCRIIVGRIWTATPL